RLSAFVNRGVFFPGPGTSGERRPPDLSRPFDRSNARRAPASSTFSAEDFLGGTRGPLLEPESESAGAGARPRGRSQPTSPWCPAPPLWHGLPTVPPARPQVSLFCWRPAVGGVAWSGDQATTAGLEPPRGRSQATPRCGTVSRPRHRPDRRSPSFV